VRCFYHPDYTFPLPEEHPFPMDKFWRSAAMIREASPPHLAIHSVEPAPESALLLVHTHAYLEKIRTGFIDPAHRSSPVRARTWSGGRF
jgi:acetoin utilization deacetylase AcuC-like enzyme